MALLQVFVASAIAGVVANDNGLAKLPPMGWRSWNLYGGNVKQDLIMGIMDGMVSKKRSVDGKPTSLCDLGFCDVGLDDNWQACKAGTGGNNYHDSDGNPIVNKDRFPDMKNMTDHAHKLGLSAGWYGNNCICSDHKSGDRKFYEGDAKALRAFGFDGYKLDGCGSQVDMQLWDDIFKSDGGGAVMVENCHWGSKVPYEPNRTWCPWNFYRSSGDVSASFGSIMGNLNSVTKFSARNLSYPGCWAYPDMLEVGCHNLPVNEARTHFGAWAIVSSPLTLSHDVNDDAIMDQIWPIISNKEAIAVSQSYAGFSGGPFQSSSRAVKLDDVNPSIMTRQMTEEERQATGPTVVASSQYFYKPLDHGTTTAVLLINSDSATQELKLNFADVPGIKGNCKVRDIWERKDLGSAEATMTFKVASHDSAFLKLTGCTPGPKPQPPKESKLVNPKSGKCLEIASGDFPKNEAQAQLMTCKGGDNQHWQFQGNTLINPSSGKCLDINNHDGKQPSEIGDQAKVELYSCNGLWNQQWELKNGQLVNTPSGKCVDLYASTVHPTFPEDSTHAQLYTCHPAGTDNQAWELHDTSEVIVL